MTLTQRAHDGYTFSGWGEACAGAGTCVVSMDADKLVTANFTELPKYPVAVKRPTTGVVSSYPDGILCGGTNKQCLSDFSYASVTATPNQGYEFFKWVGCTSPVGNVCKINPTERMTLRAIFKKLPKYEVKVIKNALGSVSINQPGLICPEKKRICSVKLYKGTSVMLTATPQLGYTFVGWSGHCSSAGNRECALIIDGNKSIQATFQ